MNGIFICMLFCILLVSCGEKEDTVVFYSKDTIASNLVLSHANGEETQDLIVSTDLNLSNSSVFNENLNFLHTIEITKFSYKIKALEGSYMCLSKVKVYIGDVSISEEIDFKNFDPNNFDKTFTIKNPQVLLKLATCLNNNENVKLMCREENSDSAPLHVAIEFQTELRGIFKN